MKNNENPGPVLCGGATFAYHIWVSTSKVVGSSSQGDRLRTSQKALGSVVSPWGMCSYLNTGKFLETFSREQTSPIEENASLTVVIGDLVLAFHWSAFPRLHK